MNKFEYLDFDSESCVCFVTNGKYKEKVIVDARVWDQYANRYKGQ